MSHNIEKNKLIVLVSQSHLPTFKFYFLNLIFKDFSIIKYVKNFIQLFLRVSMTLFNLTQKSLASTALQSK